ncbi:MAG TPA: amidohydrolase family protein [Candidatus Acidoferrales bacterium]|nr:amidohydrolase family protein [Candidatus Acidoferrales bacterium]
MKAMGVALAALAVALPVAAQEKPVVLRVSTMLDGRGHAVKDQRITVEGGKITAVEGKAGGATSGAVYDLRGLTVLPGWIDGHVHPTYHFGPDGRAEDKTETPQQAAYAAAANVWITLLAGFTTIQSVGSPDDKPLRDAINSGALPGPRILTSLEPFFSTKPTPEELRAAVRQRKADGADLIKIFASKSIREGGGQTMSDEQLAALCGEAKVQGLRTLVHAHSSQSIQAAVRAGCSQIEHGVFATDEDLRLMAERGVYFDPQAGLVFHNYFDNKARFLGIGNYNEEGFAAMEKAVPLAIDVVRRAWRTPNLKMVFGTDAVAGAHGHNAEEFIYRVRDAGQGAMDAMVSANSLGAQAMGLGDRIGAIAVGMDADIIALDGNPLEDITAVRHVVFVMKGGKIYKNEATSHSGK